MLDRLVLTKFRRHSELVVDFTDGLQVIRSANEGGKSSMLEAIGYALFGTKALRTSLDDAVTWGDDVKKLKVELTLHSGTATYQFTRSKGGAEVITNGKVFVTGQSEVSTFAAGLLGAEVAVANKIMFASQGGIRGAIEEGPKPLSLLIEDLAGFSTFDMLLEAAQNKLALGTPTLLEERVRGAESTLAAALENCPPKPNSAGVAARISELSEVVSAASLQVPELEVALAAANAASTAVATQYAARMEIDKALDLARDRTRQTATQLAEATAAVGEKVDVSGLPALQKRIDRAEAHSATLSAFRKYQLLPTGERWDGTAEEFQGEYDRIVEGRQSTATEISGLYAQLKDAKGSKITHDKCDKCGQDITHMATVKDTNAKADAAIAALLPQIKQAEAFSDALEADLKDIKGIRAFGVKFQGEVAHVQNNCTFDITTYPPSVTWNGDEPETDAPEAPYAELRAINQKVKERDAAAAKLEFAVEQNKKADDQYKEAKKNLSKCKAPSASEVVESNEKVGIAALALTTAQSAVQIAQNEIATIGRDHEHALALWSLSKARIDDATKLIDTCNADLGNLTFNNNLVKKLRSIRPIIANKLWASVLASVSVMFSQMRGENSVVTKDKDGFKANGQAIESLSGSTLDVLGIALRCSLLKTFIPQCGLLVLDEPAAGCDLNRTEAMLGFLHGAGMSQTLLVTHEEISSATADNIITI